MEKKTKRIVWILGLLLAVVIVLFLLVGGMFQKKERKQPEGVFVKRTEQLLCLESDKKGNKKDEYGKAGKG